MASLNELAEKLEPMEDDVEIVHKCLSDAAEATTALFESANAVQVLAEPDFPEISFAGLDMLRQAEAIQPDMTSLPAKVAILTTTIQGCDDIILRLRG